MRYLVFLLVLCAACQPDPTPFPVDIPPTITDVGATAVAADTPQPIRYALAANMAGVDTSLISAEAQVEVLTEPINTADLGVRFDVIVTYGDLAGAAVSPLTPRVSLLVNVNFPPLDDSVLADILQHAVNPADIANALAIPGINVEAAGEQVDPLMLRSELANVGLPDGFEVVGGVASALGSAGLQATLRSAGIDSRWGTLTAEALTTAFSDGRVQLGLVMWTSPEQRARWETLVGADNVIDLFSVPISYLVGDGLTITFTPDGLPLVTR
jgi:hypothetical protein